MENIIDKKMIPRISYIPLRALEYRFNFNLKYRKQIPNAEAIAGTYLLVFAYFFLPK